MPAHPCAGHRLAKIEVFHQLLTQVARLFRCAWGTVATAVEEAVAYGLANRDLEGLTHIGIDEVSRKRGTVAKCVQQMQQMGILTELIGRERRRPYAYRPYIDILSEGTEPL